MHSNHRPSSETRPLLEEAPPSYRSVEDDDAQDSHPLPLPPSEDVQQSQTLSRADLIWVLAGLWLGVFLGAFDGTVVATLLTPIGSQFEASDQASYIGTSYLLSVCCFTPLYGRLADIIGRRGAMLTALSLFGSGTIFCGLAPSMGTLLAARAVSGMGGGGVMTVASITVSDLIPLKQRGLYQGMANILYGLGAGLGGPVGGWINDTFGWRSAFYVQTPLFVFSFVVVALKVKIPLSDTIRRESWSDKLHRVDGYGSLTLVTAVGCLLLGFSLKTSEELPWSHPLIYGLLTASLIASICFGLVEKYWASYPVMPLHLLTQRTPFAVSMSNLLASMTAFSTLYNAPLYFSAVRLDNAVTSGVRLLPHSISISAGSVLAGWYMRRTGKLYNITLASSFLTILASASIAYWNDSTSTFRLWFDLVPHGFGMASLITTTLIAMIAAVYKEDMAVAIGITYLFRTTGQVLGVSFSSTILQAVLLQKLRGRIQGPGSSEIIDAIRRNTESILKLDPPLRQAAVDSYADALRIVFTCQVAVNILAFIACLPIQENPLPATREEQEQRYRNWNNSNRRNTPES